MSAPQQSGSTHVFGICAIAMFLGLDEAETARRIVSNEIPVEFANSTRMAVLSKAKARELIGSAHFQRHLSDADFVAHFRRPEYSACPQAARLADEAVEKARKAA